GFVLLFVPARRKPAKRSRSISSPPLSSGFPPRIGQGWLPCCWVSNHGGNKGLSTVDNPWQDWPLERPESRQSLAAAQVTRHRSRGSNAGSRGIEPCSWTRHHRWCLTQQKSGIEHER